MDQAIARLQETLAYPAQDPRATLLLMLAFVALGMLIAVILLAIASPRRPAPESETLGELDADADESDE